MARRAPVWLCWTALALLWTSAESAERPTGEAIRAAVAAAGPAVVDIEVKGRQGAGRRLLPNLPFGEQPGPGGERQWRFEWPAPPPGGGEQPGDPLRRFREAMPFLQVGRAPSKGTGVIVAAEGDRALVAAPHGLLEGAEEVIVRLADGRELAAKFMGSDRHTATGCLEIRGPNLKAAKPGDAAKLQVGDWVLAIGGPESGGAVTIGIVSTEPRPGQGDLAGTTVVQTDALVPEEMAGGPLVNLQGETVAITLARPRGWQRGAELTAALPFATVQATVATLAKEGKVARGWLGVMLGPLDPEARRQLKIDHGIQVAQVLEGQPADRAGIRDGDVLLELNGKKITDVAAFRAMVGGEKPGARVTIQLLRGGERKEVEVTLGEQTPEGGVAAAPGGGEHLDIGLALQPLTPELAQQLGFAGDKGLLVTAVDADGPAAKARPSPIGQGEVIKEIARETVTTLDQARKAVEEARKGNIKTLLILVRSKDGTRYVVVDLPR